MVEQVKRVDEYDASEEMVTYIEGDITLNETAQLYSALFCDGPVRITREATEDEEAKGSEIYLDGHPAGEVGDFTAGGECGPPQ